MISLIGFVAGILTTFAFVPQVWKTWRSRSADGLSLVTLIALTTGVALWLVYGILIEAPPVIAANAVTLVLQLVLLSLKLADIRRARSRID